MVRCHVDAILLGTPAAASVVIPGVPVADGAAVELLGYRAPLAWRRDGEGTAVDLPPVAPSPALSLRFSPAPA